MALVLVVLEIAFRLLLPPPQMVDQTTTKPLVKKENQTVNRYMDESFKVKKDTGIRMKKNLSLSIRNHRISGEDVDVQTNSLGYRHKELEPKTEKDFRVLVLGDSITLGEYLPLEQTYPAIIEKFLKGSPPASLQNKNIEIINAGVNGIDLSNEYAILMETGLGVQPDVVIVGLYLNDAIRSVAINHLRVPKFLEKTYLYQFLYAHLNVFRKLHAAQQADFKFHKKKRIIRAELKKFIKENEIAVPNTGDQKPVAAFNRFLVDGYEEYGFAWSPEYWTIIEHMAGLFQKAGQDHGFQLVIVLFPMKLQLKTTPLRDEPQRFFTALMKELNILHLDIMPSLLKKSQATGKNYFHDTCHLTSEGTEIVGQAIAEFIKENMENQ